MTVENEIFEFKYLLQKLRDNRGVDFSGYKQGTLQRRINSRLRVIDCKNEVEYISYLNAHSEEYDALLNALTINVTEFFRNSETFSEISEKVIPAIIKKSESHKIRVWSAGCSSGEEPYSLAILFKEAMKSLGVKLDINIIATDIDLKCIAQARNAIYSKESVAGIDKRLLKKYFTSKDDKFALCEEVKDMVSFEQQNLVADPPLKNMNLVLCRNVLIYFTRTLQDFVISGFNRSLTNDGYLVLGKVESLSDYTKRFFESVDLKERIYIKK